MDYDLLMIRHGATEGNLKKRYVGRTDEPLCREGILQLQRLAQVIRLQEDILPRKERMPGNIFWILSPMRRCIETMEVLQEAGIFPALEVPAEAADGFGPGPAPGESTLTLTQTASKQAPPVEAALTEAVQTEPMLTQTAPKQIVLTDPDLRECDFGRFENLSYLDLKDDPAYQAWIDSGGTLPFPEGEDPDAFRSRCCEAFERCAARCRMAETPLLILAAHGGTIMSILAKYGLDENGKKRDYFDWQPGCAQAYVCRMETGPSGEIRRILVKNKLETKK